jgi:hypothetical protein
MAMDRPGVGSGVGLMFVRRTEQVVRRGMGGEEM